jgi:hypothetical protein
LSTGKFSLGRQAKTGKKLQSPINSGVSNFGIDLCHLSVDLGKVLVTRGVEKDVEDLLPLFCRLQPFPGDPLFKSIGFNKEPFLKLKFNFILIDLLPFVKGDKKW